jgi:membrane protein implicated in regulation of membrane protease activity
MENIWLIWIITGIILVIGEIFTPSFFLALIGLSCLIAGAVAFFIPTNLAFIPLCVFAVSTALMLIYLRPICKKYLYNKDAPSSNVDAMKGKILTAETKIDGTNSGTVKLYADLWKARTEDDCIIEAGEKVRVIRIEGNTVIVSKNSASQSTDN